MKAFGRPLDRAAITTTVNGSLTTEVVSTRLLLSDFIRETLGLTGTHVGCEHGICGACTVLIDGRPMRSCLTLAVQTDGREVTTIEGITPAHGLNEMQAAFKQRHGLQCGFCTPGFLMTLAGVEPADHPTDEDRRDMLSGNVCRCTGYQHILEAIADVWGEPDVDIAWNKDVDQAGGSTVSRLPPGSSRTH